MQFPAGAGLGEDPTTKRFVHHGSLAVDREIEPYFRKAESYLRRDPTMRHIVDDLERSPKIVRIVGDAIERDSYMPRTRTIYWDPLSAARTLDGGRQSPALGLGHEMAHADMDPRRQNALMNRIVDKYDNDEERRVIVGAETHAARTLGEGTRTDHGIHAYHVRSPIDRY